MIINDDNEICSFVCAGADYGYGNYDGGYGGGRSGARGKGTLCRRNFHVSYFVAYIIILSQISKLVVNQ